MLTRNFGNYLYNHRALFKRFLWTRQPVLVQLPKFKMYVRLDDWLIGARIFLRRRYEAHVSNVVRTYLKPGQTVFDLGANVGYYTLLAAHAVGAAGKVIAFEPSEENCRLVRASVAANGFTNVTLYPFAVSDRQGSAGFTLEESNGSLVREPNPATTRTVPTVALDQFIQVERRLDVIKMDIEGAESLALAGMSGLVRAHQPVIFTEVHPRALAEVSRVTADQFLDQFRELGYALHVLKRSGETTPAVNNAEFNRMLAQNPYEHLDVLALP